MPVKSNGGISWEALMLAASQIKKGITGPGRGFSVRPECVATSS